MARPVFDAITNSTTTNTSSGSFNHTVASGGSLLVCVSWYDRTGVAATSVSSITFNGDALTFAGRARQNFATNDYVTTEIWYIDAPDTGAAYSVAWTLSEANDSGDGIAVSAISVTGAGNGIGSVVGTATGNSNSPSVTVDTDDAEGLIIAAIGQINATASPYTPGSGETERGDGSITGGGSVAYWIGQSDATGGSDTVSATASISSRWCIVAVEVLPANGGGGSTYDESVTLARFQAVTSANNLIIEAAATLGRELGVSEGDNLQAEAAAALGRLMALSQTGNLLTDLGAALNRQVGIAAEAGLLLDSSLSLARSLAIALASDVTKDVALALARSLAVNSTTQLEAEAAVSLARALTIQATSQADFETAVNLARANGIAPVGTLEINSMVSLSLFLALTTGSEIAGLVVGIVHLNAQGRDFALNAQEREFDLNAKGREFALTVDGRPV